MLEAILAPLLLFVALVGILKPMRPDLTLVQFCTQFFRDS